MAYASTVTMRIESASTSDINVQDVSTASSSDDDLQQESRKKILTDRHNFEKLSLKNHRSSSAIRTNHHPNATHRKRSSDLNANINSMHTPRIRPTTTVSLPTKSPTSDNQWNLDSTQISASSIQQRNPSCPSISSRPVYSKSLSSSSLLSNFTLQQVPPIFTTSYKCLGNFETSREKTRLLFVSAFNLI